MCELFLVEIAGRFSPAIVCKNRTRDFGGDWPVQVHSMITLDQAECMFSLLPYDVMLVICGLCSDSRQMETLRAHYRDVRYY